MVDKTMRRISATALLLGLLGAQAAEAQPTFTDVATSAGVGNDVYSALNFHSLGANWVDYDNDGWADLFLVNGINRSAHLYRNNGNGTFTNMDSLLPSLPSVDMGGSRFADYDNDGDTDIFIYTDNDGVNFGGFESAFELTKPNEPGGPPDILLQNQGSPTFNFINVAGVAGVDDLASAPLGDPDLAGFRSMTAGWVDYDRDGCLDLYVGHWVLNTYNSTGGIANKDRLYHQNKSGSCLGTFSDATESSGVNANTAATGDSYRPALGFISADFNGDNYPDLFVVNAHDQAPFEWDFIYQNDGDGTFTEMSGLTPQGIGVNPCSNPGIGDDSGSGMGIDVADIDLDGDFDVYMSDILDTTNDCLPLGNVLYLNQSAPSGPISFAENSAVEAGVVADFSWGVNFLDADNDGYEDLYVATNAGTQKFFYRNNRNGTFTDVGTAAGVNTTAENSRGSAVADYDRDGDLDLVVVNQNGGLQLFRNDTPSPGGWVQLKLTTTSATSNRSAIGAVVQATAGSLRMLRLVKGGSSGHSQDDLIVHFGVGPATAVSEVKVTWPSGTVEYFCSVLLNARNTVTEGSGQGGACTLPSVDVTAPTSPYYPAVTAITGTEAKVTWGVPHDDIYPPVFTYAVFRDGTLLGTTASLEYTDTGLTTGANYCYTVTATDASLKESSPSSEACLQLADTTPPTPPTDLAAAVVSSTEIRLTWTAAADDVGVVKYLIYRGADAVSDGEATGTTYNDQGLSAGTSYTYTVTAVDAAGNESFGSNTVTVQTSGGSGGGGGGGFCFIATAAYGSPMAPQVELLREFRDRYLASFEWGRKFIEFYNTHSPSMAETIRGHEGLQEAVRLLLWPAVAAVWLLVKASIGLKLGLGLGLAGFLIVLQQSKRL
jgi:chitodextrinase